MKFLQRHGFVCNLPQFVQTPSPNALISTPFRVPIRKPHSPPKTPPCISLIPQTKCLTTRFPTFSSDFSVIEVTTSLFHLSTVQLPLMAILSFPFPCFPARAEQISTKINIESVLVSVDDFFNRYPYFVASLAFIWLVVIPLTEEYLNKFKFISCLDAFRKLRDDPSTQLLDIRKKESVRYLKTPKLKILNKGAVNVEFVEGSEEEFVKEVLRSFEDPGSTIPCVLDNFDGNSIKVAELLFKSGFKEVYAIKGGMLGKDGWQAIQETLLPPSLHVYPTKKHRQSLDQVNERQKENDEHKADMQLLNSFNHHKKAIEYTEIGQMESGKSSSTAKKIEGRSLSPYPNYVDMKPPSSPTPSKPQS